MGHVRWSGLVVVLVALCGVYLHADEGMWPLNRFPSAMLEQRYGFKPTPQWLEQIQLGSAGSRADARGASCRRPAW